jgi:hypothetical protein
LDIDTSGVPLLIVGEKHFIGYWDDKSTGAQIERAVEEYVRYGCVDLAGPILGLSSGKTGQSESETEECRFDPGLPRSVTLPLVGEIDPRNFSLPALTLIMAGIDGFNPCAMWVLLFLISLLLGMENRMKMWALGITFLVVSAGVYFVFLAAWLNLILFMGFVTWVRLIIALVAFFSGF